jgi:hypothetical protein
MSGHAGPLHHTSERSGVGSSAPPAHAAAVRLVSPCALGAARSALCRVTRATLNTTAVHALREILPPGFHLAALAACDNDAIVFVNDAPPPAEDSGVADDAGCSSPSIVSGQHWCATFHTAGIHECRDPPLPNRSLVTLLWFRHRSHCCHAWGISSPHRLRIRGYRHHCCKNLHSRPWKWMYESGDAPQGRQQPCALTVQHTATQRLTWPAAGRRRSRRSPFR